MATLGPANQRLNNVTVKRIHTRPWFAAVSITTVPPASWWRTVSAHWRLRPLVSLERRHWSKCGQTEWGSTWLVLGTWRGITAASRLVGIETVVWSLILQWIILHIIGHSLEKDDNTCSSMSSIGWLLDHTTPYIPGADHGPFLGDTTWPHTGQLA